ncbi:MAG TPA: class I SAM-dependent methyltransferase [Terriglobales bacterium]|nr:class I SAM-dependent methyltransferase [Terriglobales bacterium]
MAVRSNIEWQHWGALDPMYGVSSIPGKGRQGRDPWNANSFYSRSQQDIEGFVRHWRNYGLNDTSCVEIGCGAGRITMHLQQIFRRVEAVDVSEGMLALAAKVCDPVRVHLHRADGRTIPLPDNSVTAAFSVIVFQHLNAEQDGECYLREIHRVLSQGSSMMINLPMYSLAGGGRLARVGYKLDRAGIRIVAEVHRLAIRSHLGKSRVGRRFADYMHRTAYEQSRLLRTLAPLFDDLEIRIFYVPTEERHLTFLFGKKR